MSELGGAVPFGPMTAHVSDCVQLLSLVLVALGEHDPAAVRVGRCRPFFFPVGSLHVKRSRDRWPACQHDSRGLRARSGQAADRTQASCEQHSTALLRRRPSREHGDCSGHHPKILKSILRPSNGPADKLQGRASLTEPAVPLTAGGPARMVAPSAANSKTITARSCQLQRLVGRPRARARE